MFLGLSIVLCCARVRIKAIGKIYFFGSKQDLIGYISIRKEVENVSTLMLKYFPKV